ncbi:hypothetical protein N42_2121 [Lactococcus lactis subsp. lactis]|uniref:Uncharacterized protein n=1 Tax=Lactococcus lactis subsp. lactis TaxID=1360 RepID=A0A0V8EHR7_LACLL|nr:hypothetical protein N42_2121 [Lactococcus lactis subsp. lactis]
MFFLLYLKNTLIISVNAAKIAAAEPPIPIVNFQKLVLSSSFN